MSVQLSAGRGFRGLPFYGAFSMKIKYVGDKPIKEDNLAGTGTIWVGQGDVHDIPDKLWPLFAAHPNVWQRADGVIPEGMPEPGLAPVKREAPVHRYVARNADGEEVALDDMEDAQLKAFAQANGLPVDLRKRGDTLRQLLAEAASASAEKVEA